MSLHVGEVLLSLFRGGSTQTFVVLDAIGVPVFSLVLPFGKLGQRIKGQALRRKRLSFEIRDQLLSNNATVSDSRGVEALCYLPSLTAEQPNSCL